MPRVVAVAVVVTGALTGALTGTACSGGGDDTLEPLPVDVELAAATATSSSPGRTAPGATTPGGLPAPAADPAPETSTGSTPRPPTGDWDGERFDVGTIEAVATEGAYTTIEFDRWSYTDPDGLTVDAGQLTEEPVAAWWRSSPFANLSVQTRTFVLAPGVEVLTLDPAGRAAACAEPRRVSRPVWERAGTSALDRATDGATLATLTYGDSGLVTRIRLTRGC